MTRIKKKDLEIKLEDIPPHPDPDASLEQYSTPSPIASDILFKAFIDRRIKGKDVADLGCGTGIFALGSAYLGARSVVGVDIDPESVKIARQKAMEWSLSEITDFKIEDIDDFKTSVDTVLMNPPFGSQKKGADLPFLEKAFEISETVYTLHNAETVRFLEKFIKERGHSLFWEKRYKFEMDNLFKFHEKEKESFEIISFGINVKR